MPVLVLHTGSVIRYGSTHTPSTVQFTAYGMSARAAREVGYRGRRRIPAGGSGLRGLISTLTAAIAACIRDVSTARGRAHA
eukprot:2949676-Rhodomonas_salina.1